MLKTGNNKNGLDLVGFSIVFWNISVVGTWSQCLSFHILIPTILNWDLDMERSSPQQMGGDHSHDHYSLEVSLQSTIYFLNHIKLRLFCLANKIKKIFWSCLLLQINLNSFSMVLVLFLFLFWYLHAYKFLVVNMIKKSLHRFHLL